MRRPAEESAASGVPSYKNRVAPGKAMTRQWVCISVQPQDIPMGTGAHQNGAGETPRALISNQPPDGDSRNGSGYLFKQGETNNGHIQTTMLSLRPSPPADGILHPPSSAVPTQAQESDYLLLVRPRTCARYELRYQYAAETVDKGARKCDSDINMNT